MDVSSKDFSLKFRGFEHDDPETVRRFTVFCEANFALSPETVNLLRNSPETIVLTHGSSIEELEALAKVLREIGAVVDVSPGSSHDLSALVGGPSSQELHRLFGSQSASENDDTASSHPYPPPLGRSLYLLSNCDAVVDRRALRQRARQNIAPTQATGAPPKGRLLYTLSGLALVLGLIALLAAALLLRKEGLLGNSAGELPFQPPLKTEKTRREAPRIAANSARALTGSATAHEFAVELKIIASPSAVSISSLTFTANDHDLPTKKIAVRSIIGEPTFLNQSSPGTWTGSIILSVFVEENGVKSLVSMPASITVLIDADQAKARASIEVARDTRLEAHKTVSKASEDMVPISGIPFVEVFLS